MKISYGKLKRRSLIVGDNKKMRPTQSMAKSIIFNLLDINESTKVVDLFAGTGALGFEAVSAGAGEVYWSDNNYESFKAIKENIKIFNLDENKYKVFKSDFRLLLKKIPFKPNLIFLDPPFIAQNYYDEALNYIFDNDILQEEGLIVIERKNKSIFFSINKFELKHIKKFGDKEIIILKKCYK